VFRIVGAIREVEQALGQGGLGGLRAAVVLLSLGGVVVALVPGAALAALAVLAPFGAALAALRRLVQRDERRALELTASLEQQLDALVRHAELWRVAGTGAVARGQIRALGAEERGALARARGYRAALSSSNEALAALGVLLLVGLGSGGALAGGGSSLVVFAAMVALTYRPLRDWGDAQGAWASGQQALGWLAPWLEATEAPAAPRADWPLASLTARGFGAQRHGVRWDFTLAPGSLVLVLGPNGGGKTTLLRALLGLDPSEGSLRYGEVELAGRGVGPGQRPFAWAPQEAPLLSLSLAENLALGGAGSLEEARKWLGEGPAGLAEAGDERLGEGGRPLSGGERAWVSLARAWAAGQPVLLLDEPAASLDAEAEARLVGLVEGLRGQRTVLVVTHRPGVWQADHELRVGGLKTKPPQARGRGGCRGGPGGQPGAEPLTSSWERGRGQPWGRPWARSWPARRPSS